MSSSSRSWRARRAFLLVSAAALLGAGASMAAAQEWRGRWTPQQARAFEIIVKLFFPQATIRGSTSGAKQFDAGDGRWRSITMSGFRTFEVGGSTEWIGMGSLQYGLEAMAAEQKLKEGVRVPAGNAPMHVAVFFMDPQGTLLEERHRIVDPDASQAACTRFRYDRWDGRWPTWVFWYGAIYSRASSTVGLGWYAKLDENLVFKERMPGIGWIRSPSGAIVNETYELERNGRNLEIKVTESGRRIHYTCPSDTECVVPVNVIFPEDGSGGVGSAAPGGSSGGWAASLAMVFARLWPW